MTTKLLTALYLLDTSLGFVLSFGNGPAWLTQLSSVVTYASLALDAGPTPDFRQCLRICASWLHRCNTKLAKRAHLQACKASLTAALTLGLMYWDISSSLSSTMTYERPV